MILSPYLPIFILMGRASFFMDDPYCLIPSPELHDRSAVLDTEIVILQACPESFTLKRTSLGVPLAYVMTKDPFSILILSMGRGWLVVEKPSGLSIQEEQGQDLCSFLQCRINTDPDLRNKLDCDPGFGVLPVHRLDRETSGVILLACQPRTFSYFAKQFEHHKVRKRYIALLHGDLPEPAAEDGWGLWTWPLSKEAGGRLHPEGRPRAVPSETRFPGPSEKRPLHPH